MIAMSVFAMALQLTMKTHLWQVTLMQQIDRHRMALRALEARSAIGDGRGGPGDRRQGARDGRGRDASHDAAVIVAITDALTARLPSPEWTRTDDKATGKGWTVCWTEGGHLKNSLLENTDSEAKRASDTDQREGVDEVHCESLALP